MYLDNMNAQHKEIHELVKEIQKWKFTADVETHAEELTKNVAKLAGVLSVHLAAEDKYLYPSLMKSEDATVRECAKRFADDMGDLSKDFNAYKSTYNTAGKIKGESHKFVADTSVIIGALLNRLQKEDMELYPLVKD